MEYWRRPKTFFAKAGVDMKGAVEVFHIFPSVLDSLVAMQQHDSLVRDYGGCFSDCPTNTVRIFQQVPDILRYTAVEVRYLSIRAVVVSRPRNSKYMREISKYLSNCAKIIQDLLNTLLYLLKIQNSFTEMGWVDGCGYKPFVGTITTLSIKSRCQENL